MVEQAAVYAHYREMRHLMLTPALDGLFRMPAATLPTAGLYAVLLPGASRSVNLK